LELRGYLKLFRKRWRLILLVTLAAIAVGALLAERRTPSYSASVTFFVSVPASRDAGSSAFERDLLAQSRANTYVALVDEAPMANAIKQDLGLNTSPQDLLKAITVTRVPDTVLFTVTVNDPSPGYARRIINSMSIQFPRFVEQLERGQRQTGGPAEVNVAALDIPLDATVPPSPLRTMQLALLVGLILGVALAVLRESLDTTVSTPEDVQAMIEAPTLATISKAKRSFGKPLIRNGLISPAPEEFRRLRINLYSAISSDSGDECRSIVFTSAEPGEAKSTIACNLAISLSQSGMRVLLLDADLRSSQLSAYMGIDGSVGLVDVLWGRTDVEGAIQVWGDNLLEILPSGSAAPNPVDVLHTEEMAKLLRDLERRVDVVLIDTPALLPVADAVAMSMIAGGTILVARAGFTRGDQLKAAANMLTVADARVLGVVLAMTPPYETTRPGGH
jgi:capsular exopolysaccharide synthesis family protein